MLRNEVWFGRCCLWAKGGGVTVRISLTGLKRSYDITLILSLPIPSFLGSVQAISGMSFSDISSDTNSSQLIRMQRLSDGTSSSGWSGGLSIITSLSASRRTETSRIFLPSNSIYSLSQRVRVTVAPLSRSKQASQTTSQIIARVVNNLLIESTNFISPACGWRSTSEFLILRVTLKPTFVRRFFRL